MKSHWSYSPDDVYLIGSAALSDTIYNFSDCPNWWKGGRVWNCTDRRVMEKTRWRDPGAGRSGTAPNCANAACVGKTYHETTTIKAETNQRCLTFQDNTVDCARKPADAACPQLSKSGVVLGWLDKGSGGSRNRHVDDHGDVLCKYRSDGLIASEGALINYVRAADVSGGLDANAQSAAFNKPIAAYCLASEYDGKAACRGLDPKKCPPILTNGPVGSECMRWYDALKRETSVATSAITSYCSVPENVKSDACRCFNSKRSGASGNDESVVVNRIKAQNIIKTTPDFCWIGACSGHSESPMERLYTVEERKKHDCPVPACLAVQQLFDNANFDSNKFTQIVNCKGDDGKKVDGGKKDETKSWWPKTTESWWPKTTESRWPQTTESRWPTGKGWIGVLIVGFVVFVFVNVMFSKPPPAVATDATPPPL